MSIDKVALNRLVVGIRL